MYSQQVGRAMVQEYMDDPEGKRWAPDFLDYHIALTLDDLWGDILSVAPYFTSQWQNLDSITDPGYINTRLQSLATNPGHLTKRFYRVQKLTRNGQEYREVKQNTVVIEDDEYKVAENHAWFRLGYYIYLSPFDTDDDVEIRYSYLPTAFYDLDEDDLVEWPEGFDTVWIYEAAGRAMLKGSAEDSNDLLTMAAHGKRRMLSAVSQAGPGPKTIDAQSTPEEWGSV